MMIGELILLNPNSHENIDKILSELKTTLRIVDGCEWVFLGCENHHFDSKLSDREKSR